MTYRDLVGDPEEYNPTRDEGDVSTTADVDELLDGFSGSDSEPTASSATEKVRAFLDRRGVPTDRIDLSEHPTYGTIQIATAGLSEPDFQSFLRVMRAADGIGYDPEAKRHYCYPEWVDQLPAGGGEL